METKVILTTELLKEIKGILDNADWTYSYCRNEGDSQKAVDYLQTQKFSVKYLQAYFNQCDTAFIEDLMMSENVDMVTAFAREAAPRIAGDRCSLFTWKRTANSVSNGWYIEDTCFEINL